MKRLVLLLVTAAILTVGISLVIGAPQDAQSSVGTSAAYSAPAANNVSAQGGNVTNVNVSSDQSTQKWQGFWGNVSGSLRLGDGSDVFYDWSSVQFQAVFASPGNAVDWASAQDVNTTTAPALTDKDTDFAFNSADSDSINSTFQDTACGAGTVLTNAAGVTPYNSSGAAGSWETCIGHDTAGAGVDAAFFGTDIVWSGADGYNGQNVQYQLMVPVVAAGDNYYFYLEI